MSGWQIVTTSPLAMITDGSMLVMFSPSDHASRLARGELDPAGAVWLVRTPSPAHALSGWHRCSTGRGLFHGRVGAYGRGPPARS